MSDAKFESNSFPGFGDMTSQKRVAKFGYLPPENRFNFEIRSFYVQILSFRPKIDHLCQFQQFSSRGNLFHFQNFWDVSMRKEQQQPP